MNRGEIGEALVVLRCHARNLFTKQGSLMSPVAMRREDGPGKTMREYRYRGDIIEVENLDGIEEGFVVRTNTVLSACSAWQKYCKRIANSIAAGISKKEKGSLYDRAVEKLEKFITHTFQKHFRGASIKVLGKGPDLYLQFQERGVFRGYSVKTFGFNTAPPSLLNASVPQVICFDVTGGDWSGIVARAMEGKKVPSGREACRELEWTGSCRYADPQVYENLAATGIASWFADFAWYCLKHSETTSIRQLLEEFSETQMAWSGSRHKLELSHFREFLVSTQMRRLLDDWDVVPQADLPDGGVIVNDMETPSVIVHEAFDRRHYGRLYLETALFDIPSSYKHESGVYLPQGYFRQREVGLGQGKKGDTVPEVRLTAQKLREGSGVELPCDRRQEIVLVRSLLPGAYRRSFEILSPALPLDPSVGRFFYSIAFREDISTLGDQAEGAPIVEQEEAHARKG